MTEILVNTVAVSLAGSCLRCRQKGLIFPCSCSKRTALESGALNMHDVT